MSALPHSTPAPEEPGNNSGSQALRVVNRLILALFLLGLCLFVATETGLISEVTSLLVGMAVVVIVGVLAALIAVLLSRENRWSSAIVAYNVAVCFLFLGFSSALQYHAVRERELVREYQQKLEAEMWKGRSKKVAD